MEPGLTNRQPNAPFARELEPYRQLLELQKQMVRLAQQNERTLQVCAQLRERLAGESIARQQPARSLRQRVNRAWRRLPGAAAAKANLISLAAKEPSRC